MNWNQQWQIKNAELQLRKQGKKLSDYPWPGDEQIDWYGLLRVGRLHTDTKVRYDKDGQIVIEVK